MPAVAQLPGVPPLASYIQTANIALLTADAILNFFGLVGPQWGVFLDGVPVVTPDTIFDVNFRQDYAISDYPQELGAFESYDKVVIPFIVRVRMLAGGDVINRQNMLDQIEAIAPDTNLYDVVTPEAIYTGCNVMHYDYDRQAARGRGVLAVDVWFQQIRISTIPAFGFTQSPTGTSQQSNGVVQAQSPTSAQQNGVLGSGNLGPEY